MIKLNTKIMVTASKANIQYLSRADLDALSDFSSSTSPFSVRSSVVEIFSSIRSRVSLKRRHRHHLGKDTFKNLKGGNFGYNKKMAAYGIIFAMTLAAS